MWRTALADGIRCAGRGSLNDSYAETSAITAITAFGLDIAKTGFAASS